MQLRHLGLQPTPVKAVDLVVGRSAPPDRPIEKNGELPSANTINLKQI